MRAKVGKLRNTVFFRWFGASILCYLSIHCWGWVLARERSPENLQKWSAIFRGIPIQTDSSLQPCGRKITVTKAKYGKLSCNKLRSTVGRCGKQVWVMQLVQRILASSLAWSEIGRSHINLQFSHAHSTTYRNVLQSETHLQEFVICAEVASLMWDLNKWTQGALLGWWQPLLNRRSLNLHHLCNTCSRYLGKNLHCGCLTGFTRCAWAAWVLSEITLGP